MSTNKGFQAPKKAAGNDDEVEVQWVYDPKVALAKYRKWYPHLKDDTLIRILFYQGELIKFNRAVNLVGASTIRHAESTHFADSIEASKLIVNKLVPNEPLYDFGSGNGFPGMVFAILNPLVKVVLIDRDQRKLEFCKHIANGTKTTNIEIVSKAIEEIPEKSLSNVVARGFASLQKAMLLSRKQFRKGGKFFHMKSDGWANELAQVPTQLFSHWTPSLLGQYRLPDTSTDLYVVLTEKLTE